MNLKSGITIVGSGNVAWALSHVFSSRNVKINKIVGRNKVLVKELADEIDVPFSYSLEEISQETDLVLLCVSDGAIEKIAEQLKETQIKVAHTAGSVPLSALSKSFPNAGVFYPFQTFTKQIPLEGMEIPVCIEALNPEMTEFLKELASLISCNIVELDSENRRKLHLAGVIANNFSNYLISESFTYLDNSHIDTELLLPILQQTIKKLNYAHPGELQTGPAARGSVEILNNHTEMLANNKDLQDIYKLMSEKILQHYNKR